MPEEFMETTEKQGLQKRSFLISGMYCVNCRNIIEKELKKTAGIMKAAVNYRTGHAAITYDDAIIDFGKISAVIENLGYQITEESGKKHGLQSKTILRIIGTLVIILALFMLMRIFTTSSLAAAFPLAREGMSYAMLIVIGLLTSVHCIAMCGGINLSQTLNKEIGNGERTANFKSLLFPSIFYNSGRLVSYTAVGVLVGALGSVFTISGSFQGAVQLIAGVFMVIMGINMLGLFPSLRRFIPSMPKIFAKKIDEQKTGRGPLVVGFLNGFMPCGPLQAMQVYALSTGNPVKGGISMFLFCLGTIPLMFALGAVSSVLSGAKGQSFSRRVMQIGAILVTALGLVMFSYGLNLSGIADSFDKSASGKAAPDISIQDRLQIQGAEQASDSNSGSSKFNPVIKNGVQIVNSILQPGRYPAITVQQGIPVRWIINAPPGSINGCNNRMIIREYDIQHAFRQGENVIEFTPEKTGKFRYSCWMGMIRSSITVIAEGENADAQGPDTTPKPAGVPIPAETIAVAQIEGNIQTVTIRLGSKGFYPAIVVMQKQLPALWKINIDSPAPGNSSIIFPAYYAKIETVQGENQLQLIPDADFEFYTIDGLFFGYVKAVNDITRVNVEAVKSEASNFKTLIYPEAYFEAEDY